MNDFTSSRRLFVGGVLAVASFYIASVGSGALKACHPGVHDDLVDLQPLIRIGDAYLNSMAESGELSSALYEELLDDRDVEPTEIAGIIQRHLLTLVSRTRLEFMHGETVSCDGWVLAKSEARTLRRGCDWFSADQRHIVENCREIQQRGVASRR